MKVRMKAADSLAGEEFPDSLAPGQTYTVIGIEADDYRLLNSTGQPFLYPPELFDVVDAREPSDWVEEYGKEGERYAYPPEIGEVGFFEDYFDNDPHAIRRFQEFLKKREPEDR